MRASSTSESIVGINFRLLQLWKQELKQEFAGKMNIIIKLENVELGMKVVIPGII